MKSTGETIVSPNTITITIDGDRASASGKVTAGTVHQGELAFTAPVPTTPAAAPAYTPPFYRLTGHGYAGTSPGVQAIGATLSLFI